MSNTFKKIHYLAKLIVFLIALVYILDYVREFDIINVFQNISAEKVMLATVLLSISFLFRAVFLMEISLKKIRFFDAISIEFYSLLLNLGIASSFFSLPKIALLNSRLKDLKSSVSIFFAHAAYGVVVRLSVIAAAATTIVYGIYMGFFTFIFTILAAFGLFTFEPLTKFFKVKRQNASLRLKLISLTLIQNVLVGLSFFLCLSATANTDIGVIESFFVEGASYLSGFFSPIPTGLGVREVVITELAPIVNMAKDASFAAAAVNRVIIIVSQMIVGLLILTYSRFR